MCKATLDFVEQQSTSLASLLQRRPAQCLQHVADTRGVPKLVEDKVCRSPLDCFDLGHVFLRVWVPDRCSILQQWADKDFISFFLNVGGANL